MKISFVVPSVSSTVLGVVTNHARILSKDHDVQIVGPDMGGGVCPLYKDVWPYTIVSTPHLYRIPEFLLDVRRISDAIEGDVVIAVKSFAQTILPALRQKKRFGKKIMVYLDEWDGALYHRLTFPEKMWMWLKHAHHPTGEHYVPFMEKRFKKFDRTLCSTSWLAKRFAGDIIHFGVDAERFNPKRINAVDERCWNALGLSGKKVIVFGGVVRPHKGIEQVLMALDCLSRDDVRLLIAGPDNEHVRELRNKNGWGRWLACSGAIAKDEMPRWIKKGDAVVLPLVDDVLGRTQMPCKVFEAMAMAKPIIATDVSDLGRVLHGCGMVLPPNDVDADREAISKLLSDAKLAKKMGEKAREKCLKHYCSSIVSKQYSSLIDQLG